MERDGERCRADIQHPNGRVIEFQHSRIDHEDIHRRERVYQDMLWVFDAEGWFEPPSNLCKLSRFDQGFWTWKVRRRYIQELSLETYFDLGALGVLVPSNDFRKDVPVLGYLLSQDEFYLQLNVSARLDEFNEELRTYERAQAEAVRVAREAEKARVQERALEEERRSQEQFQEMARQRRLATYMHLKNQAHHEKRRQEIEEEHRRREEEERLKREAQQRAWEEARKKAEENRKRAEEEFEQLEEEERARANTARLTAEERERQLAVEREAAREAAFVARFIKIQTTPAAEAERAVEEMLRATEERRAAEERDQADARARAERMVNDPSRKIAREREEMERYLGWLKLQRLRADHLGGMIREEFYRDTVLCDADAATIDQLIANHEARLRALDSRVDEGPVPGIPGTRAAVSG